MIPRVSIITITLNSESYLAQTIASVLSQSYQDFEYLIVDGGSSDRTLSIAESYQDKRIKVCKGKDTGITDAMNRGIRLSTGALIGIIHSDDLYLPNAIKSSMNEISRQRTRWSYGQIDYIDLEGNFLYTAGRPFQLSRLKRIMSLNHASVFILRELYQENGLFDTTYKLAMDYELCLRFALKESPAFVPETIAKMRVGGASSKSRAAELFASKEGKIVRDRLLPEERVLNATYFHWQNFKIRTRYAIYRLSWGEKFISAVRPYINPNFSGISPSQRDQT